MPAPGGCRPRARRRPPQPLPAGTDLWALRGENLICLLCMVVVAIQFSRSFKFGCFREFEVLEFGVVGGVAVGEKRNLKA